MCLGTRGLNRTFYGIETGEQPKDSHQAPQVLIVPFMELKPYQYSNVYRGNHGLNRTFYGIETNVLA